MPISYIDVWWMQWPAEKDAQGQLHETSWWDDPPPTHSCLLIQTFDWMPTLTQRSSGFPGPALCPYLRATGGGPGQLRREHAAFYMPLSLGNLQKIVDTIQLSLHVVGCPADSVGLNKETCTAGNWFRTTDLVSKRKHSCTYHLLIVFHFNQSTANPGISVSSPPPPSQSIEYIYSFSSALNVCYASTPAWVMTRKVSLRFSPVPNKKSHPARPDFHSLVVRLG